MHTSIPRSKSVNSLPTNKEQFAKDRVSVGKLLTEKATQNGNQPLASGALKNALHLYITTDAPKLDDDQMYEWEASEAGERLREALIWLYEAANPGSKISEVPPHWWMSAGALRRSVDYEPDTFEFAYLIWSMLAEPGSTIEGI
jgi:hypothetical protein